MHRLSRRSISAILRVGGARYRNSAAASVSSSNLLQKLVISKMHSIYFSSCSFLADSWFHLFLMRIFLLRGRLWCWSGYFWKKILTSVSIRDCFNLWICHFNHFLLLSRLEMATRKWDSIQFWAQGNTILSNMMLRLVLEMSQFWGSAVTLLLQNLIHQNP